MWWMTIREFDIKVASATFFLETGDPKFYRNYFDRILIRSTQMAMDSSGSA
jgi:hypothetical protein